MYSFGKASREKLDTCDERLQTLMNELIKIMDVSILCGTRGEEEQNKAFASGASTKEYPNSKHNSTPSNAVDVAPYPIDWNNIERFERMCGIIEGIAKQQGIEIRLGRDFSFKDYPHIQLNINN